jgi:Glycosyl hydrolases family 43
MCPAEKPNVYRLSGDIAGTQDPSIIKEGKTWYVFATGKAPGGGQIAVRCSGDLEHWKLCGHVFDAIPAWILERSPGTKDLRAPDISYVHHEYRLYYAYSLFGKNTSGIALATNKSLDPTNPSYKWTDKGLVLESKAEDNFNAIDPNFVLDGKGGEWLAFGRGGFMDTTVHPVPRSLGKRRYRTLDEKRRIVEETLYITLADGPRSKHGLVFRSPVINKPRSPLGTNSGSIQRRPLSYRANGCCEYPRITGRQPAVHKSGRHGKAFCRKQRRDKPSKTLRRSERTKPDGVLAAPLESGDCGRSCPIGDGFL